MLTTRSGRLPWARRLALLLAVVALLATSCSNSGDEEGGSAGGGEETASGEGGDLAADLGEGPHGENQPIEGVPGVTDDEIRFAVLSTGDANPIGYCLLECQAHGVEAYFAFRNSQGGVNGRDLVFDVIDDELGSNQAKALEIIESGDYFGVIGAPIIANGFADLAAAGIPTYTGFPQALEAAGQLSIYQPQGALCLTCPSRQSVWPVADAGASVVASIGFGDSQASKDCVTGQAASVERWGDDLGIEMGYTNSEVSFGLANGLGPEVTAMKEAGVDFILTCFDQNSVITLEEELERQGMGDVPLLLLNAYGDEEYLDANAELLEGDYIGVSYRPFEADPAGTGLEDFTQWMEETGNPVSDWAMLSWINADLAFRGILAAGSDFDQAKVVEATNTFTDYTADGLVNPTNWTRQHEPPTADDPSNGADEQCFAYVRVQGGETVLQGDAEKPHMCWDPTVDEYVEPTPTSYAG